MFAIPSNGAMVALFDGFRMACLRDGRDVGLTSPGQTAAWLLRYGIEPWRRRGVVTPMLGYGPRVPARTGCGSGPTTRPTPSGCRGQLSIGSGVQRQETLEGPAWGGELRTTMRW